jgi:hypothetical protein
MGGLLGGLSGEEMPAGRAQAVVPAVPVLERVVTAQTGGGAGVGHTWGRGLVHRAGPHAGADAMNIKIDKFY